MSKEPLPIYQIQDYQARDLKENYFYLSSLSVLLQEHQFIQKPHKHNFYIILYINKGTGTHTIDFQEYEVKPGLMFFLIPGQVHNWQLSKDADGFIIFFTSEFYLKQYPQRKLFHYPFFNALLHKPILSIPSTEKAALLQTIELLGKEHLKQGLMKQEMLSRYLDILMIHLTRIYEAQETEPKGSGGELAQLQALGNLIDLKYKEHPPVSYYADQLHVTTKQLSDICKRSLGKTINDLIQERTILEAQRLLVHSELTSSQIAAELGFYDSAYFFRFFKKQTGLTPEQFRSTYK